MIQPDLVSNRGMVVGTFLAVGGPYGAKPATQRGWITLESGRAVVKHVRVAQDGRYSFSARPGRYRLFGLTPQFQVNGHQAPCDAAHPVTVRAGLTTHADVYCQRN
jgi:hypothetical protein